MQTFAFREWLRNHYLQLNGSRLALGTQISRAANCSTIEKWEGDLDAHFDQDGMADILKRLTYSILDQQAKLPPGHQIPINGDICNGSSTYRSAANLYRKFRVAQQNGLFETSAPFIQSTIPATERSSTVKVRVGQQRFRYLVLERWDYRCAVTGASILLAASHIKPWRLSSDSERLDSMNGICLSPLFDRAFDVGIITFHPEGQILISPLVPIHEVQKLGLNASTSLQGLTRHHRPYLKFHRENIWQQHK